MAETTADVRRDIEMTRERMSDTLAQLEHKMNVVQMVKDHPWPALALAVGAGVLLSGSKADVKAAAATAVATRGTSSRMGAMLDDLVSQLVTVANDAFNTRVEGWVNEIKTAIGAPASQRGTASAGASGATQASTGPIADRGPTNTASSTMGGMTGSTAGSQVTNPNAGYGAPRAD